MAFGFGGKKADTVQPATSKPAAKASHVKPEAKPIDLKATKKEAEALRADVNPLLKDAKDAAKQDQAAVKAQGIEQRADALLEKADANLRQANVNASSKGAGNKEAHEVGVAKSQKVDVLRIKADAIRAQIPAAEAKAKAAFDKSKKEALAKKPAPAAKEGEKPKTPKLSKQEEGKLRKEAYKDVNALEAKEKTCRSAARKIETEAKKSQSKDARDGFVSEVRDRLKTIENLLRQGEGSTVDMVNSAVAARASMIGKLKASGVEPNESQLSMVDAIAAQRGRYAPKGGHAARVEAEKTEAGKGTPAR